MRITATIHYPDGKTAALPLVLMIMTADEVSYYKNGGILPYVLRNLLAAWGWPAPEFVARAHVLYARAARRSNSGHRSPRAWIPGMWSRRGWLCILLRGPDPVAIAAIAAWWPSRRARAPARLPIRFGAMLFAAFAVSWGLGMLGFPELMPVVAMMALSLGGASFGARPFRRAGVAVAAGDGSAGSDIGAWRRELAAPLAGSPLYALGCALIACLLVTGMAISKALFAPGLALLTIGASLSLAIGGFAMLEGAWIATAAVVRRRCDRGSPCFRAWQSKTGRPSGNARRHSRAVERRFWDRAVI